MYKRQHGQGDPGKGPEPGGPVHSGRFIIVRILRSQGAGEDQDLKGQHDPDRIKTEYGHCLLYTSRCV